VIGKLSAPGIDEVYNWLSGASHGGLASIGSWRDLPDDHHPEPRRDPAAQNRALAFSSRLVLNYSQILRSPESAPARPAEAQLNRRVLSIKSILVESQERAMRAAAALAERRRSEM